MIEIQSKNFTFLTLETKIFYLRIFNFIFQVEQTRITLRESGVQLNLSCVDTPGFGDEVNNDKCWDPVIEFIEQQFELYLNAESRVEYGFGRKKILKVFLVIFFVTTYHYFILKIRVRQTSKNSGHSSSLLSLLHCPKWPWFEAH